MRALVARAVVARARGMGRLLAGTALAGALLAGPALAQGGPVPAGSRQSALAAAPFGALPQGVAVADWPGADYDPAIPRMEAALGHPVGAEIAPTTELRRYADALAAAAPDRVRVVDHGRSWQGRPLFHIIISSPANMARLDQIQAGMARLSDPRRTSPQEAERLIAELPAVVWLAASVHGNEPGTADAALLTAYHLLAARGDARVPAMLEQTVVIINPVQNPDGRDRFIQGTVSARGLVADGDPLSAERDEPWPGGRFNHYLFDLNRDWFAQSQPETRAHAAALLAWRPVVMADLHEMYTESSYFFPPAAQPTNPWLDPRQEAGRELVGRNNARWFDHFGLSYFTREVFDLFYPGYGDGWPAYQGAIAMTYEQGSSRGLVARRRDDSQLTFADTVFSQFVAALSTVETAAENRARFLRDLHTDRAQLLEEGRKAPDRFLIVPGGTDRAGVDALARLLAAQGVEVGRVGQAFTACRATHPVGSLIIDTAQPLKRLIRVLMEPAVELDPAFAKEQERRRARGLPDEIYDVTAWSLPLLYNLDVARCDRVDVQAAQVSPVRADAPPTGTVENAGAALGYLVPWGDVASARFLAGALRAGLRVRSADEGFTHGGTAYPAGTLILERARNSGSLTGLVQELAVASGTRVVGVQDSWVTDGPGFGSDKVWTLRAPRVALAWDAPTDPTAAGATRFVLERELGWPVTAVRTDRLARADLSQIDVLILPAGRAYLDVLGLDGAEALKGWVQRGGTLIGLGSAVRFLAHPDTGLMSIRREDAVSPGLDAAKEGGDGRGGSKEKGEEPTVPGTVLTSAEALQAAIAPDRRSPDSVSGVLLRARVDGEHWLAAGLRERLHVLVQGADIYTPVKLDAGSNVVRFSGPEEVLASGYLWEENRRQLAFKPFVVVEPLGRGHVIAFTADPTLRGFMHGLTPLLANAVFRSPGREP